MANDAIANLRAMFSQWGLNDLADWVATQITSDVSMTDLMVAMYDRPEYQRHFPAMAALRAKGQTVSEAEYRSIENGYRDVLRYAGLAGSTFDSKQTYSRLIESQVSARELEERVADAKMVTDATDPNVKRALREYYGIGETDLLSYALDPQGQGKDHVERLARSATLRGIADTTRLNLSKQYSESIAMDTMFDNAKEADYREALAKVSMVSDVQKRLAGIDRETFTDEDAADVALKSDVTKTLASRKRAERESARFSGSAGLAAGSLKRSSL